MSKSLESMVWQSALDADLKPLAAVMADMGNDDGYGIYPSVEKLAWLLGVSERAVQYKLRKLRKAGILEVSQVGGGRFTTKHRLVVSKLPARDAWIPKNRETPRGEVGCTAEVKPVSPDPLVDPLGLKDLPPTPRKSYREPKTPEPDSVSEGLMKYLADLGGGHVPHSRKQREALTRLVERHRPEDLRACLDFYRTQEWRKTAVTWVTVENEIDQWLQRPKEQKRESRNLRNIRESLEYLDTGILPSSNGGGDNQGEALLLAAGLAARGNGGSSGSVG